MWDSITLLNKDKEKWTHYFWTNNANYIKLNETACQGRCEIKVLDESILPGYNTFKPIIEEMISKGHFSIDHIRVLATYNYGGYYMDTDVSVVNSPAALHYKINMYAGMEVDGYIGMGAGTYAVSPKHKVIKTWMQLLQEFHNLTDNNWGARKLIPNPIECEDFMFTNGPRFFTAAFYMSNN